MSELTQPKANRLMKVASAADLVFLTVQDYSNLIAAMNGKVATTGGTMTGFLTLNADPTAALHAATKQYVDSKSTGDVATHAALTTAHGSTPANTPGRIMQRDANGNVSIADPTAPAHAATRSYVDAQTTDKLDQHAALTNAHGAVSGATAGRIVLRDGNGRAQVAAPTAPNDIAILQNVTNALAELYAHINDDIEPHPNAEDIAATPLKLVVRDAAGRSKIANPASGQDIANYQWVVSVLGGYAAINPSSPKNGDIQVTATTASLRINGVWRQVFPAQYS